jgi:lactate permease
MKVNKELVKRSAIDSLGRMSSIAPIIFLSVFISQLMLNSGGSNPSMTDFIARSLALSNLGFENLSVFIGVIGAFISGGNTISNVVFGPSVLQASDMLSKNSSVSLALLSSGGAIGNAICLFNIVAACSIAGIKDQRSILKINAIPVLCCAVVVGLIGVILSMIF